MNEQVIDLHWADWLVVGIYGAICFGIAFWAMRQIKDAGGLLVGKRNMGKWMMAAASFAGGTNANHPMSTAAAAYKSGMPGIWISLTWMLITPFFWIFPPLIRRLRIVTLVDIVQMRFGPVMEQIFKIVGILTMPISMAFGLKSAAILIELMTGGVIRTHVLEFMDIDPAVATQAQMDTAGFYIEIILIGLIAIPTLIYSLMGGVIAAYATDVFQGILIIVLSFLLIPFAISEAGGVAELNVRVNNDFASLFGGMNDDFGFWWIFWFAIACIFTATTASAGGAAAAKNEFDSRMKLFGLIAKRFCTVGWGLVGVLVIGIPALATHSALDPAQGGNPDFVFALASGELLPVVLRGVMVASILAAVMSSLDAGIIGYGGVAVNNFYQEHFVKNASPKHYLLMTRVFATVGLLIAWYIATADIDLVHFATIVEPLGAITGIAILTALVWRRLTAAGAIASVLVIAPLFLAVNRPNLDLFGSGDLIETTFVLFERLQLRPIAEMLLGWYDLDPTQFINADTGLYNSLPVQVRYPMFLLPALFIMIVVSLFTKQHNQHAVDEFYCRLDTAVGDEQKIRDAGFKVDRLEELNSEVASQDSGAPVKRERLILCDLFYLPRLLRSGEAKWSDYKTDLIGIVASIIFVIGFVYAVHILGLWLFHDGTVAEVVEPTVQLLETTSEQ